MPRAIVPLGSRCRAARRQTRVHEQRRRNFSPLSVKGSVVDGARRHGPRQQDQEAGDAEQERGAWAWLAAYSFGEKLMCRRGLALRDSGCATSIPKVTTGRRTRKSDADRVLERHAEYFPLVAGATAQNGRTRCHSRRTSRCRSCSARSRITSTVPVSRSLPPDLDALNHGHALAVGGADVVYPRATQLDDLLGRRQIVVGEAAHAVVTPAKKRITSAAR